MVSGIVGLFLYFALIQFLFCISVGYLCITYWPKIYCW